MQNTALYRARQSEEEATIGYGDEIIASGLARGAAARGKRIAFGDGRSIIWSSQSHEVLANNPNVARPGEEGMPNLEWVHYYKGNRFYARESNGVWLFNENFHCPRGEIFFNAQEKAFAAGMRTIGVVIEPRVKRHGACVGANKQWPISRYQKLAHELLARGIEVSQLVPPGSAPLIKDAAAITTQSFRYGLAALSQAKLYIGPEGGLHHASAALSVPAIVLFGGFPNPKSTGYDDHVNLTGGAKPCGRISQCSHCEDAMRKITVDEVLGHALQQLQKRAA